MTAIAKKEGFADLASFRASLKTNPKYIPNSAEQILDDFRHYIAQMEPKLPELFTLLPKSPVTVEAIPDFPVRRRNALRHRHAGRQAPRPRRRRDVQFRRALA